jgi:pimeloyl-ACP methyl ester carboxylesterase
MVTPQDTETRQGQNIQANGLNIFYEEYGQGRPLLLIHGGLLTGASWGPYVPAFAEHYRVIAPDSRGHGRTANPGGNLSYGLLADDMAALVQALDLQKPLIYGYSDGGQVAIELGMRYPDLPGALVIGGAYPELTEESQKSVRTLLGEADTPDVDIERFEREYPDFAEGLRKDHGPGAWKSLVKQVKPMWNAMLNYTPEAFASITVPTLVLVGDRDGFLPVEDSVAMYRLLPNAELMVVPGAGHGHLIFSAAKIAIIQPLILDFLQRHIGSGEQAEPA